MRDTQAQPWDNVPSKYGTGSIVDGTVSKIAEFGAFVRLEPGVEGLVHISEIAHHRVVRVSTHLQEGQEVQVKDSFDRSRGPADEPFDEGPFHRPGKPSKKKV